MAKAPNFNDRKSFEAWLKSFDDETALAYAKVLSGRANLRVVPFTHLAHQVDLKKEVLLQCFRITFIAAVARKFPTRKIMHAVRSARSAAQNPNFKRRFVDSADFSLRSARSSAIPASYSAADLETNAVVESFVYSAADSVDSAAEALRHTNDSFDIWENVRIDCDLLLGGEKIGVLENSQIWLGDIPNWFDEEYQSFIKTLKTDGPYWGFWLDWYAAKVAGEPMDRLGIQGEDFIGQKLAEQDQAFWDRGPEAVSADIEAWIEEWEGENITNDHSEKPTLEISPQSPAAYQFEILESKVTPIGLDSQIPSSSLAQDFLDEIRQKAVRLLARLQGSNSNQRVVQSIDDLIKMLPQNAVDVRPGLLRSRSHSVESDATAFKENEGELFPDAISQITDLSESLKDLQSCFPELREIEAEAIALDLVGEKVAPAKHNLDAITAIVADSDIVSDEAVDALETMQAIADEASETRVQEKTTAEFTLVVRNFARAVLRETGVYVKDATKAARQGTLKGIEKSSEAGIKAAFALLVAKLAGPIEGLAVLLATFAPLSKASQKVSEENKADETSVENTHEEDQE